MENVVPLSVKEANRRLAKMARIREERRQELIDSGVEEEVVERVLDQEEFERLPIDQKVNRIVASLDHHLNVMHRAINTFAKDIVALRHNDTVISDAHDVNLRGIYLMFESLGLSADKQKSFMEQAQKWLDAEKKAREDHAEQDLKAHAPTEQERVESEMKAIKSEERSLVS